jgi:adenine-specific DNA-methyltransferase
MTNRQFNTSTNQQISKSTNMLTILKPRNALNKAFLKVKPNRLAIEAFKNNLIQLLDKINEKESEEFHKNLISDFLKKTYYDPAHFINTKGRNDLVIHNDKDAKSTVGVIIEAKKPTNRAEMLKVDNINTKALQELVLYYLRERILHKNLEIKHLMATNIYEWFVFDAQIFEKVFAQDKNLVKQFTDFEEGRLSSKNTDFFYKEIAEPALEKVKNELVFTHFDIREYDKILRNNDSQDDNQLIALFKLLAPEHLLKLPFANDSNSLDKAFYAELLHIIGLTETKEGSKKLIERKPAVERNAGSLLENVISQLDSLDKISRLEKPSQYGETQAERLFTVGLELVITWVNRILFLKLLEAQLLTYHKGDKSYAFLNLDKIKGFDDLNSLFFQVLAKLPPEREPDLQALFGKVPYLNSSLFEPTELEHNALFISNLRDDKKLPIVGTTVLKDNTGKRKIGELKALDYLFAFLNAYDFASEGSEEIQEDNKTLINASVLGLIFEKINGYKDGSFFTPGFITMYMCRETIRRAVLQKFKEVKGWDCADFTALYNKIDDIKEANEIINSLKICDPAVGSGHFLVSALNELIALKSDLKILQDRQGRKLKEYQIEVVNDELVVTDDEGKLFEYKPSNAESQRVQETLFHEKHTLIENCLFGVDINPNSVKICRLRLWIELLKNAYYKSPAPSNSPEGGEQKTPPPKEGVGGRLETLPNIDINIKCGNSLISRFALDADLKQTLKKSKWNIDTYRNAVQTYRNATDKAQKREMERLIADIKSDFRSEITKNDPKLLRLRKLQGELFNLTNQVQLFGMGEKEKKLWESQVNKLTTEINKLEAEIEEIKSNKIYENAFEWRFEFPEVLNEEGDFVGFDVVIGNPPYGVDLSKQDQIALHKIYEFGTTETAILFIKKGFGLLQKSGNQTFIIPKSFTFASNYERIRNFTIENLNTIVDCGKVWQDVKLEVCIFELTKNKKSDTYNSRKLYKQEIKDLTIIKKIDCIAFGFFLNGLSKEEIMLGLKIINNSQSLNDISTNQRGAMLQKFITHNGDSIVIGGAEVQKYGIDGIKGKIFKDDINDEKAYIKDNSILVQRIVAHIENPIDHIQITASIPDNNKFILVDTINQINLKQDFSPLLIWALLHSNFINWYVYRFVFAKAIRTMQFDNPTTSRLPIPLEIDIDNQEDIIDLVTQILELKKANPTADTQALEQEIDKLVYELYGLTTEEIRLVEGK